MGNLVSKKAPRDKSPTQLIDPAFQQDKSFHLLVESVMDYAIFMLDPSGNILTWNQGAKRLTGYTSEEVIGSHYSQLSSTSQMHLPPLYELRQASRLGRYKEEGWRSKKEGSRFWANVVFTAIRNPDGLLVGFSQVIWDASEQKRTEDELLKANETLEKRVREQTADLERVNEELCKKEEILNRIMNSSQDCIKILDLNAKLLYINAGGQNVMEICDASQVLGVNWLSFWKGDDYIQAQKAIESAKKREIGRFVGFCPTGAGTPKWWDVIISPILDDQGRVEKLLSVSRDVTEQKKTEDELGQWKYLFEHASWGMTITTLNQRFVTVNSAFAKMHGTTPEEWTGRPILDMFDEGSKALLSAVIEEVNEKGSVIYESIHVKKDGTKFPVLTEVTAFKDCQGDLLFRAANFHDLTRQKKMEEELQRHQAQLEAVVQAMTDGVMIFDMNGDTVFFNEAIERIYGCQSSDLYKNLRDFAKTFEIIDINGKIILFEEWPICRVMRGESVPRCEYFGRIQMTGQKWFLSFTGKPILDDQGFQILAMIITRDITKEKAAEKILKESEEQFRTLANSLAKAVKARDEFLSIASHELKTPLTSLKLQIQFRKRNLTKGDSSFLSGEQLKKMIDGDEKQINRLTRLVDDMLDISRLSTGKLNLNYEEIELGAVTKEVLERFSRQFEPGGNLIFLEIDRPVVGRWDHYRIEQVLINLLTNSIKYGAKKPIQLCIQVEGSNAKLTIRDQGIGISEEDQERIFKPFERAISAHEVSGLGLGLHITKQIVEAHGGSIYVQSELGKGSTFIVELPLVPSSAYELREFEI
jgi:PAS domain S-box-containing protein